LASILEVPASGRTEAADGMRRPVQKAAALIRIKGPIFLVASLDQADAIVAFITDFKER
jgi:hypothetical protein